MTRPVEPTQLNRQAFAAALVRVDRDRTGRMPISDPTEFVDEIAKMRNVLDFAVWCGSDITFPVHDDTCLCAGHLTIFAPDGKLIPCWCAPVGWATWRLRRAPGAAPGEIVRCLDCDGTGKVPAPDDWQMDTMSCPGCNGSGGRVMNADGTVQ